MYSPRSLYTYNLDNRDGIGTHNLILTLLSREQEVLPARSALGKEVVLGLFHVKARWKPLSKVTVVLVQ